MRETGAEMSEVMKSRDIPYLIKEKMQQNRTNPFLFVESLSVYNTI